VTSAGVEEALLAIEAGARAGDLARQADWKPEPVGPVVGTPRLLTEWEGKRALARHGLSIPSGRLVASAAEAQLAAGDLGYPVVVKAVGAGIAHKSELGAVRLGLGDADAVGEAAQALRRIGSGLLVERMVTDAVVELFAGVGRDPVFGLHLVVGAGGVMAELIADRHILMLPATPEDVGTALSALRASKLLDGYRGGPRGDRAAVVDAIMAIQRFALAHAADLIELDVNPLMVRSEGRGAIAADALIRLSGG
jgi:succinyl-CoA synthetase beta subunit